MVPQHELAPALRLAIRLLVRRLNVDKSMPLGHVDTLAVLDRLGPLTGAELARHERVSPPAMTAILRPLLTAGYVQSERSTTDRRRLEITITPSGRDALQHELASAQSWLTQAIAELDEDEKSALSAALPVLEKLQEM